MAVQVTFHYNGMVHTTDTRNYTATRGGYDKLVENTQEGVADNLLYGTEIAKEYLKRKNRDTVDLTSLYETCEKLVRLEASVPREDGEGRARPRLYITVAGMQFPPSVLLRFKQFTWTNDIFTAGATAFHGTEALCGGTQASFFLCARFVTDGGSPVYDFSRGEFDGGTEHALSLMGATDQKSAELAAKTVRVRPRITEDTLY